jgi:acetylglutamate kinase
MTNNDNRASVLSEALPYIQQFNKKTVVVKYGGNAMQSPELCRAVISDIVLLSLVGIRVIVVHGGGPEINEMLHKIGKKAVFVDGLRYTDAETMDIVQMVLCGRVNKQLVQLIGEQGGRALGLSGLDSRLFEAEKITDKDLGFVGEITAVNPEPVELALSGGYIPVISTVACGKGDGEVFNINADTAAASLSAALKAEKLILLTDVRGLMRDKNDESTLIPVAALADIPKMVKDGIISGGMIPKIDCCVEAVRQGVSRAHILDGRIPHSILIEILSDEGIGTMIL